MQQTITWNSCVHIYVWGLDKLGLLLTVQTQRLKTPRLSGNACCEAQQLHKSDVIISVMASPITSLTIDFSNVNSGADQRTHRSSVLMAFVGWIPRTKGQQRRIFFPFDDVIMKPMVMKVNNMRYAPMGLDPDRKWLCFALADDYSGWRKCCFALLSPLIRVV